jgi:hypothetical protein
MSESAALGPRRFDLPRLSADDFEALCFRLARLDASGVSATRAPDGGADALLAGPAGRYQRAWQAKNHRRKIDWRKCRESLDRAVETYSISHFTFCFSVNLTSADRRQLDALRRLHPRVEIDEWGASELEARLSETDDGLRVARSFFEDPVESTEMITRAVRAGGELRGTDQAVERLHAVGEYFDGDAFFIYPITHYPEGVGPPSPPGTTISVEYTEDGRVVRIDAVPRDAEAAERFPTRMQVRLSGADAEQLERARLRGESLHLKRGADVTMRSLPPAFAHEEGRTFEAELWVDFTPDPWTAEFRVSTADREESLRVTMEPAHAPPDWDRACEGRFGGLTISLLARLTEGRERVGVRWKHRSDGSPAREQLKALRFLATMHDDGEFVMCECEGGRRLLGGPNKDTAVDVRVPALITLLTDVVTIEDWIGADLCVPAEISAEEIETIAWAAEAIRAGRSRFTGTFELVGDVEVLPQIENGKDMEIGEDWVVEIFGEKLGLGRRTVHFRPLVVHRGALVEPGRQVVEIEPGSFVGDEPLWWQLTRPEPPGLGAAIV